MLIHTTMRVAPQLEYLPIIRETVKQLKEEWDGGSVESWRGQWESESAREPAERSHLEPISFDQLSPMSARS